MLVDLEYNENMPLVDALKLDKGSRERLEEFADLTLDKFIVRYDEGIYYVAICPPYGVPGYSITDGENGETLPHGIADNVGQVLERDGGLSPYIEDKDKGYVLQLMFVPRDWDWKGHGWYASFRYIGDFDEPFLTGGKDDGNAEGVFIYQLCKVEKLPTD